MPAKQPTGPTPIDATKHENDSRINIPTEEMRDLVSEDEKAPATLLYPRDPSLDPQLVWRGKDEQDRQDLQVASVPIYIQEKIHPQALIEDLRAQSKAAPGAADQLNFFNDFNGIEGLESIDFYQHEQHWTNRMILGDSLLVMASLAEKEGLKGKVQCIYIDPPYGIKFGSNWQVSTRKRDIRDGNAADVNREPEVVKAFRDTWQLGIHSYLSYLRERLVLARELLAESGSVFVQIGDENVHLVRSLVDEVFGSENFVSQIHFATTTGFSGNYLSSVADSIVWYGKSYDRLKFRELLRAKEAGGEGAAKYRPISTISATPAGIFETSRLATSADLTSQGASLGSEQTFDFRGRNWTPPAGLHWKTTVEGIGRLSLASRLMLEGKSVRYLRFLDDFGAFPQTNLWVDIGGVQSRTDPKVYVVQTATEVVKRCMLMTTDPGDLVLDPTCGSGTTAYVAEQWGRRWITIDTSRVALALARTRLMAGRYPYYLLSDSQPGISKEAELTGQMPPPFTTTNDIKKGFVYKRVPHITLKSIANNEEIDVIHERWQPKLDDLRERINSAASKAWEEWEVPREAPSVALESFLTEWWETRRKRQAEIDASIARRADVELLYDQPYEDNRRVRVTGPFTVESLSPHRTLSIEDKIEAAEQGVPTSDGPVTVQLHGPDTFGHTIIDNLKKSGVQNTFKNERLKFERLEPFPGEYIHASGEYLEDGQPRRVAVCIGPEMGTVGPLLVKQAAIEAVQGVGFDLLLVCGFAFDPHVSEEAKRYGTLTVLPTRMNPDLAMGDDLLKKTGAGNLFMVFGEPDLTIETQPDGQLVAELRGLDVYDPTTGEVRSRSTDDIACWFIDTSYNKESFFVRHAYFTGATEPYERLKRTLRAEIDEAAWASLYSTRSRPFPRPESGKIAVKVINHYGDEVLKVYDV